MVRNYENYSKLLTGLNKCVDLAKRNKTQFSYVVLDNKEKIIANVSTQDYRYYKSEVMYDELLELSEDQFYYYIIGVGKEDLDYS